MDEIIKLVAKKTGLSNEMSKLAVETVLNYLKKKLPAPVAAQIDALMQGKTSLENIGGVVDGLGSLMGKSKKK